jgi:hypothetical protein
VRHKDNLRPEGEYTPTRNNDYKPTKGERAEVVIHEDHLRMEGKFDDSYRSRNEYTVNSFYLISEKWKLFTHLLNLGFQSREK